MTRPHIITARQAAELVNDGDVITVSSSSGLNCPDAVLAGIGQRFEETSQPTGLTSLHAIAAGDMSGIKGIDHIARPGLLKRVVAGSYPSGPSSAEPPKIWQMIDAGEVEAYNLPSGVIYQMHRAAATHQPGVHSKVGIGSFIDPRIDGGRMNDSTPRELVEVTELRGEEYLFYDAITPNVAIIRATTADENGNLTFEHEASSLGALDLALAAHNNGGLVIAQVKRVVSADSLEIQHVRIPGVLVDVLVVAPDQMQTTQTQHDPAISGEIRRPLSVLDPVPFSLEKVTARRAALELHAGDTVNLGFGVSALVPHILVEEGLAGEVRWIIEQGAVGGVPLLDFKFGASMNPDAIMQSADMFTVLQGGGFDRSFLSFLEIGRNGDVNVHHLPGRRHVTAGVGGFADIVSAAPEIVFVGSFTAGRRDIAVTDGALDIRTDGPHTKLVERVAAPTFSGERALANSQKITYVTERAVLRLTEHGLVVTEIAPGVDLERDVLAKSAFPLGVSDELKQMDSALFYDVPLGLHLETRPLHTRLAGLASTADGIADRTTDGETDGV